MSALTSFVEQIEQLDLSSYEKDDIHGAARRIETAAARLLGKGFLEHSLEQELEMAAIHVPHPKIIFDVGASVGAWSQQALRRFPEAHVFAFEPQAIHRATFEAMQFDFPDRFSFLPMAVSDTSGEALMYRDRDGSQLASLHHRDLKHHHLTFEHTERVFTTTLREQFAKIEGEYIDILKIDVEEHEIAVIQSAGDMLKKVRYIQFEFGGTMIDSRTFFRDAFDLFAAAGFTLSRITPFGLLHLPQYREDLEGFAACNYVAQNARLRREENH